MTVVFDASASSDPGGRIAVYSWNFGDGTPTGAGVTTSHTFSVSGRYTATLTVIDNSGARDTASVTIDVRRTAPVSQYSLQFLPSDDGSSSRTPYPAAINNLRQVVGEFDIGFNAAVGRWVTHAFVYADNITRDIGTLGGVESFATDINDVGQIVGASTNNSDSLRAFLYRDGTMQDLGSLGGDESAGYSINAAGQVVGAALDADDNVRAFLYENGVMRDLGALSGQESFATAINDSGVIVGASSLADGNQHAFVIRDGLMEDLGTLGGDNSAALDVNSDGEILGWSQARYESGVQYVIGFVVSDGVMQEIRSPRGQDVWPVAMSNNGQVIGTISESDDYDDFEFIWDRFSGIRNLSDLIDPALGCRIHSAYGINAAGDIVGLADCEDGRYEWGDSPVGVLLTPQR